MSLMLMVVMVIWKVLKNSSPVVEVGEITETQGNVHQIQFFFTYLHFFWYHIRKDNTFVILP